MRMEWRGEKKHSKLNRKKREKMRRKIDCEVNEREKLFFFIAELFSKVIKPFAAISYDYKIVSKNFNC